MAAPAAEHDALSIAGERSLPEAAQRRLWVAFVFALAAHALLLIAYVRSPPRIIGAEEGRPDAVDVSFISEAELQSQYSPQNASSPVPPSDATAPAQPREQAAAPAQPPPEPTPAEAPRDSPPEPVAEPAPPVQAPAEKPPEDAKPPAESATESKSAAVVEALKSETPDLLALPDPAKKAAEPAAEGATAPAKKTATEKATEAPAKKQKLARREPLDLSPPKQPNMEPSLSGGGGAAGVERPPGTTRSGANDSFARGVIRALRQTMPQLSDIRGRVTVRIILDDNGNISSVTVVSPSELPELTRSVVFATKQTNYPIPPIGSNMADKTFTVTYIYR